MKLPVLSRFVPTGRMLFGAALLLPFALAVPFTSNWLAISILALFLAIVLSDLWTGMIQKTNLAVMFPPLVRLSKDRDAFLSLRIHNPLQRALRLRIGVPFPNEIQTSSYEQTVMLPAGPEYSHFEWPCRGNERGRFEIQHYYLEKRSPLQFWDLRKSYETNCEIRVYPNLFEDRKKLASRFLNRENYGSHARKMVGQGREFEKLREYVPGDAYDQLHWKATAKRGRPITKLFQTERTQEVYVVVDYSRRSARKHNNETMLEFYLRAALILGTVAQQNGDLFGVIAVSNRVQRFLRAGNGKAHYHACRDMLYTLQPQIVTPDFEDLFSFIRLRLRRRALIIVLTDLNDPMLAENFVNSSALVARHHLLLVNMAQPENALPLFRQPDAVSLDSIYERLSGHMIWENLHDVRNVLHRYGIAMAQLPLASLSVEVVNQYFAVKERQLL